jgi:hypothetical protein
MVYTLAIQWMNVLTNITATYKLSVYRDPVIGRTHKRPVSRHVPLQDMAPPLVKANKHLDMYTLIYKQTPSSGYKANRQPIK